MNFGTKILYLDNCLNSISKDLSLNVSYRIVDLPKYEFKKPILFGHFPWYYRLVTRGSGLYVSKRDSFFLAIAPNWNSDKNKFLESKYIIIRPEINIDRIIDFISFIKIFCLKTKTSIILKQISKPVYEILLKHGFREYLNDEKWDNESKFDDQTYPEVILKVDKNSKNHNVFARGEIKIKVSNNDYCIDFIDLHRFEQMHERELIKEKIFVVFYEWLKSFQKRNPSAINKNFVAWNLLAFDAMISDEKLDVLFVTDKLTEKPLGVFSLIKSSHSQFDVVFSFVSEFRGNFQRVAYDLLISWAKRKHECEFLNLGGSELASLYEFKKSIGDNMELAAYHLIFDTLI